jgi:HSP20 family protein
MARRDIDRLQEEIEELFADLWQVPRFAGTRHGFRPAVDCFQTDDPRELTIVVELPGVDPETVRVAVEDRSLTIAGTRPRPRSEGQVYQQVEIEYGPFQRTIQLSEDVDVTRAGASYDRGLLTIRLPITERPARVQPIAIVVRMAG